MMKMIAFYVFLTFMVNTAYGSHVNAKCMSTNRGCTVEDLRVELEALGVRTHQILSWNVNGEDVKKICQYLTQLDLVVINLQEVTYDQFLQLTETCLQGYNASGVPPEASSSAALFNPIFYRNDNTQLMEIKSGTKTGICSSLTWTRVSLQVTPGAPAKRRKQRTLSHNLLTILSGKSGLRKFRMRIPQTHYSKKVLFANVHIKSDDQNQKATMYNCLRYLYLTVNDRRRYRTVLSGRLGSETTQRFLLNFPKRRSLFKYCAPGQSSPNNKICFSNHRNQDPFHYTMIATLRTDTKNKPAFSAFMI